ncbi:hypothetical protein Bint_0980 [Brachyspira intermedia PWS/A]|uniref:Uncharacterized protein n=1 Tax=Brachyspira intermedia (strain ATCC 51140 / PWS/A) TaxID=1045858 RepID=G0EM36_BRAIP|nr:hypothetical protein [Brachyspira intermedia]AEM21605.1 hypothetical protein Bint_0980 [Brachyspira intermedia PWS/A]
MKKTHLLFLLIISIFMMSCGGHFFNPRYYYNKSASDSEQGEIPDTTPETPPEEVPENEDPFKNGDWNDPTYGGYDASKFKTWLFKASFQKDKLPIYTFFEDDTRYWISGVMDWNNIPANYYDGKDGENYAGSIIGNVSITGLKVYQYVANNPLYSKEGYLEGRLDRFNFYSINGKASVATLRQYLIAVDTYSKFIFAFGAITGTQNVAGDEVPISFEAIEKHGDKRPFFEYDPIGYVKEDGSVVLYEHYRKEFVAAPTEYMPKIHTEFEKMAEHKENGQGSSPYLKVDVSTIDPSTVLNNFKDKQYGIRDKLVLYTYTFDSTANTVTLTAEHFYDGDMGTETYTFSKVAGLTSAEYTNSSGKAIIINGIEDYNKLKDGSREYILNYNDPGPDFIYRVAGKIFVNNDENRTYEFSADGMSFKYTEGSKTITYYFSKQSDPSESKAAYSQTGSVFWGIKLSDYNGIKDGQISGAITEVGMINPDMAMTGTLASYVAYIDQSSIPSEFVETVKGKTYFYRNYQEPNSGNGNSLNAYKYVFNNDATELTYTEMVYKQEDVSTTYKLDNVNGLQATYTSNGKTLVIKLGINPNMIYNGEGSALADCTATDKGPFFLDIVRGSEYIAEDKSYSYKFSDDGKLLTFTYSSGESINYDYTQTGTEYFKAAYKQQDTWFPRYWALRVTSLGGVLEMSTGSLAFPTDILRDASYGWKAVLGSGSLVKDPFLNAVAGRVFEVRNGTDSTKLERYTFSSGGASIVYEQIDWYTDQPIEGSRVEYYGYEKSSDTKGIYKYNDSLNNTITKIEFSVDSMSPTKLFKSSGQVGEYNYQDPGPYIYDVIKGKTYKRSSGATYVVDNTGKSIQYYENGIDKGLTTTYTFNKVNNVNHLEAAYYDPKAWGFLGAGYWAVEIMEEYKDKNLYVSTGALKTPDHAINSGDYGDPYIKE